MSKFNCFYKSNYDSTPEKFRTVNSLEDAAIECNRRVNGDRNNEAIQAIKERGYYLIGYGPSMVYIEEVK